MIIFFFNYYFLAILLGYCIEASSEGSWNSIWCSGNGWRTIFTHWMKIAFELSYMFLTWYFLFHFIYYYYYFDWTAIFQ